MNKSIDKLQCQSSYRGLESDHLSSSKTSTHKDDINPPIAIRKGDRSCSVRPYQILFHINFYHHHNLAFFLHCPLNSSTKLEEAILEHK